MCCRVCADALEYGLVYLRVLHVLECAGECLSLDECCPVYLILERCVGVCASVGECSPLFASVFQCAGLFAVLPSASVFAGDCKSSSPSNTVYRRQ